MGDAANLVSGNLNTVGEGGFGAAMSYRDVLLGALTEPGTDAGEFSIEYVTGYGQPILRGTVTVIPEPGTVVMLLGVLLGMGLRARRRKRLA
ncbi:MAG: PEP-CTERM sorting domain-containing protein [Planctomycetes bacterium]|nr:PEP-CTERM sorting domain-containing protein [Planctomycetota bacterium]